MRIFFCHDWYPDVMQELTQKDGIAKAVHLLSKRHEVFFATCTNEKQFTLPHEYFPIHFITPGEAMAAAVLDFNPDVILHWADCTREHGKSLAKLGIPMALCFAGGATDAENWYKFQHIFVENEEYRLKFEKQGVDCSIAFGTNTELFTPVDNAVRSIDAYFPATFCDWKRQDLFYKATRGLKTLCAGFMYPVSERYCWEEPMKAGVVVVPHISAEANRMLMAQSKCVLVTSKNVGGSQRTVLEALAMNTPVIVMSDNFKCCEYLRDVGCEDWIVDPEPEKIRELVLSITPRDTRSKIIGKWDAETYANNIESGIMKIINQ